MLQVYGNKNMAKGFYNQKCRRSGQSQWQGGSCFHTNTSKQWVRLHNPGGNFHMMAKLKPAYEPRDWWCKQWQPIRNCHLEDTLAWDQWDMAWRYKGWSWELINELVSAFAPAPRVWAIDSSPTHSQPPTVSTVGQLVVQGVNTETFFNTPIKYDWLTWESIAYLGLETLFYGDQIMTNLCFLSPAPQTAFS